MLQIDEDLTARVNMADYKFTFHEKGKEYNPAWIAPEGQWLHVLLRSSLTLLYFLVRSRLDDSLVVRDST